MTIFDVKPEINKLTKRGIVQLNECINKTKTDTKENTKKIENVSVRAFNNGQFLLDSLSECTKKSTFNLLSCYREIITHQLLPVKKLITSAIIAHKDGHLQYIDIKNFANDCVDNIVEEHDMQVAYVLNKYIPNTTTTNR